MKVSNKVRRIFSPLNITVTHVVSGSALSQVYNAVDLVYEPNRLITPTVVTPVVVVHDTDGVFGEGNANRKLGSIKWYVNGVDITTLADYTNGLYSIDNTDTNARGSLTIYKNVAAASPIILSFKAILPDTRNATNLNVAIDNILLSTQDIAADKYTLEIDQPVESTYNPIGLSTFNYVINPVVFRGDDKVTDLTGLTFVLSYMSGTNKVACTSDNTPELLSLIAGVATFDLRLIQNRTYFLQLLKTGSEVAALQFSIARRYPVYTVDLRDYGDIKKSQKIIPATAIIHANKTLVSDPGQYFSIVWKTYSATVGTIEHNMGENAQIPADITGVNDGPVEVYCEVNEKPAMQVASDSAGIAYCDSNNEPYIFN